MGNRKELGVTYIQTLCGNGSDNLETWGKKKGGGGGGKNYSCMLHKVTIKLWCYTQK